ncbi:hypothetical protein L2E82_22256 [Cichorium intybus]|uniref:Uncharacterized protein n=1 Tax=Cichorium intybus TaxID=13427 RepID=A0ACB9DWX4_CICIN|nr:hypothetical protein L2E82_22256 [Cichorium intybus]
MSVKFPKEMTSAAGGILLCVTTAEHGGSDKGSEVMGREVRRGTDVCYTANRFVIGGDQMEKGSVWVSYDHQFCRRCHLQNRVIVADDGNMKKKQEAQQWGTMYWKRENKKLYVSLGKIKVSENVSGSHWRHRRCSSI